MKDIECPYCGEELEINHDDGCGYSEGELHQQTCCHCDKTFTFWTSIYFSYDVHKADCLNDGEHIWEVTHAFPIECRKLRCKTCGEEKPLAIPTE